jgi:hypothetical protein
MTVSVAGQSGDGGRDDPSFKRARQIADSGHFEFAIEMFIQGLELAPHRVDAHRELRTISLERKSNGGRAMGLFETMKLKRPTKNFKHNMLMAEKLLSYDPGNTDHMLSLLQNAAKAGLLEVVDWIEPILRKAIDESY